MKNVLFWDFDGTLVYSKPTFFQGLSAVLRRAGCSVPAEEVWRTLRESCSWYRPEEGYPHATGSLWWESLFSHFDRLYRAHGISPEEGRALNREFREIALRPETYTLYEDSAETLRRCAALGWKSYILSNNFPELLEVVRKLGLSGLVEDCIVSSNVGYEKPRRELFLAARRAAGGPRRCCMVGDNPEADIRGAHAAGFATILVHRPAEFPADFHCDQLREIPALLKVAL